MSKQRSLDVGVDLAMHREPKSGTAPEPADRETRSRTMKALALGVAAMATSFSAAAASESRIVRYDDIDLSTPAGLKLLERRIDSAARSICGDANNARGSLTDLDAERACMAQVRASAASQMAVLATSGRPHSARRDDAGRL